MTLYSLKRPIYIIFFAAFAFLQGFFAIAQQAVLQNHVFHVEVSSSGEYKVVVQQQRWQLSGSLGARATHLQSRKGVDRLGSYHEVTFVYDRSGMRQGSIRIYDTRPVLQCEMRMLRDGPNQGSFPEFHSLPDNLYHLGFQPVPHSIYKFDYLGSQGPWVLFDPQLHVLMMSPADHFFVTEMRSDASGAASGITSEVADLPRGFSHKTILVAGQGINQTFANWGQAMQQIAERLPPNESADILLRRLSYWTDHGAAYFYNYDPQIGYPGTLIAVKNKFSQLGLPIGSMQLDSWFYPKGEHGDWHKAKWTNGVGGAYLYEADKSLFPSGLAAFSREINLPLITHARWIDRFSPYRKLYKMSGNVIVDPRYWQKTAAWLHDANVAVYEQDWMGRYAKADVNLTDPEKFHDMMAHAMQRYGLTMQYCMATPADFMQGTHYNNLTTVRTSHDRFDRKDWDMFLYDSRMATALGIWPWTDVFRSSEEANLAIATLSAGPVGVGDSLAEINVPELLHAVRGDGVIVKPDVTIRPLDRMYLQDAQDIAGPMVANSWTAFGKTHIAYVFAYPRNGEKQATLRPEDVGFVGSVYIYNWRTHHGVLMRAQDMAAIPIDQDWGYVVISPVGDSGMALVGDIEQFATAGRNRIRQFSDDGHMHITIQFAPNEKARTIAIYGPHQPQIRMVNGTNVKQAYDDQNHLFLLTIAASRNNFADVLVQSDDGPGHTNQRP